MIGCKHLLWSSAAEDGTFLAFKWCEPAEIAANRQARAVSNTITHDDYIGYQAPNRPIGTQARCDSWAGAQPTLKSTYNGAIPTMVATAMTEEQTST